MTTTYNATRFKSLKDERESILARSRTLLDQAKAQARDLNQSEAAAVEAGFARIKGLDAEIADQSKAMVGAVMSLGNSETDYSGNGGFSEAGKSGILTAIKSRTAFRTDFDAKAALLSGSLLPAFGTGVAPGMYPNAAFPLASLFPVQEAGGPTVRYYRMTAGVANVVAEGALKPDSGVVISGVDIALTKLVASAQFSDEMQEDSSYLIGYLQAELGQALVSAENALFVSTWVATSGVLTATGAAATVVDMIADAVAAQEAISGTTPSAIVAHPSTIATVRKSKASTSGVYNVDVLSSAPSMLHGVQLVSTPAVAAANVWVVCGSGTTVYRRGAARAELGTSGDDFAMNLQRINVEERLAVAVTRPSSLSKLVLT